MIQKIEDIFLEDFHNLKIITMIKKYTDKKISYFAKTTKLLFLLFISLFFPSNGCSNNSFNSYLALSTAFFALWSSSCCCS